LPKTRLKIYRCHQFQSESSVLTWTSKECQWTYFSRFVRPQCSAYDSESLAYSRNKIRSLDGNISFHNGFSLVAPQWQTWAHNAKLPRQQMARSYDA
jgi:hypothetical protein